MCFFGLTRPNLNFCEEHCLLNERYCGKLLCNAATFFNIPLELSQAFQFVMWIFQGRKMTYIFHPE